MAVDTSNEVSSFRKKQLRREAREAFNRKRDAREDRLLRVAAQGTTRTLMSRSTGRMRRGSRFFDGGDGGDDGNTLLADDGMKSIMSASRSRPQSAAASRPQSALSIISGHQQHYDDLDVTAKMGTNQTLGAGRQRPSTAGSVRPGREKNIRDVLVSHVDPGSPTVTGNAPRLRPASAGARSRPATAGTRSRPATAGVGSRPATAVKEDARTGTGTEAAVRPMSAGSERDATIPFGSRTAKNVIGMGGSKIGFVGVNLYRGRMAKMFDNSKPGGRFLPNPSWSTLLSSGGARAIGPASLEFVGQRAKSAGDMSMSMTYGKHESPLHRPRTAAGGSRAIADGEVMSLEPAAREVLSKQCIMSCITEVDVPRDSVTQREMHAGIRPVFRAPPPLKRGKDSASSSPQHADKTQSGGGHRVGPAGHLAPSHTAPPAKALYKTHLKKTARYQVDTPLHLLPSRANTQGGGLGIYPGSTETRNRLDVGTPQSFAGDGAHHKWRRQYLHGDTYKQRSQAAAPEVRWKLGDYTVSYGASPAAPAQSRERVHEGSQREGVTAQRDARAEADPGDEAGGGVLSESVAGNSFNARSWSPERPKVGLNRRDVQVESRAGESVAVSDRASGAVDGWARWGNGD